MRLVSPRQPRTRLTLVHPELLFMARTGSTDKGATPRQKGKRLHFSNPKIESGGPTAPRSPSPFYVFPSRPLQKEAQRNSSHFGVMYSCPAFL